MDNSEFMNLLDSIRVENIEELIEGKHHTSANQNIT